ncbi:MAG: adenylate/guanylate cyclase domain-containing protein [Chloroflexota bacterium]
MSDYPPEIIARLLQIEGIDYAILDARQRVQAYSPGLPDLSLAPQDSALHGQELADLFPELVGYDEVLAEMRAGRQSQLLIERIYRASLRGQPGYVTLRLLPHADGWLLVARDATTVGLLEQRITQQRNEISLLAARLETARARLDDLLHRFVPGQVADIMLNHQRPVLPGGERRQVSVLFADLRGFAHWAAERQPEMVLATINAIFESALPILLEKGATLDKFIGDAIMAFFNAPGDQPDHAQRALECARQLQNFSLAGLELRFGIGVSAGPVVAGNVGTLKAMQYTILGDTVNLAKRLEERAGPGEVLFSPAFLQHLEPPCHYAEIGQLQLKGRSQPMTVYRLLE